jgi:hypothetical protein
MNDTGLDLTSLLEHHGVKGMHWGVHRANLSTESGGQEKTPRLSEQRKKQLKTAAIVGGAVIGTALIAAGTAYAIKNGGLPKPSFSDSEKSRGKSVIEGLAKSVSEEPTGPVFASRGKHSGNRFLLSGGLRDPLPEYERAGFDRMLPNSHARYGRNAEKIAVSFHDPQGRKDFSGRPILHEVVIPAHHASGIDSYTAARDRAWELVQKAYEAYHQQELARERGGMGHMELDLEPLLEHHGVKGMHWGVRRGRNSGPIRAKVPAGSSEDHQRAALITAKIKRHGGVHALSNEELRILNDRRNLETSYGRLQASTSEIKKGRQVARDVLGDIKMTVDAINTGRQVYDEVTKVHGAVKGHRGK